MQWQSMLSQGSLSQKQQELRKLETTPVLAATRTTHLGVRMIRAGSMFAPKTNGAVRYGGFRTVPMQRDRLLPTYALVDQMSCRRRQARLLLRQGLLLPRRPVGQPSRRACASALLPTKYATTSCFIRTPSRQTWLRLLAYGTSVSLPRLQVAAARAVQTVAIRVVSKLATQVKLWSR